MHPNQTALASFLLIIMFGSSRVFPQDSSGSIENERHPSAKWLTTCINAVQEQYCFGLSKIF
jgi:hypothetical protein